GERVEHFEPITRDAMQYLYDIHPPGVPMGYALSDSPRHGFLLGNSPTCSHCLIGDPGYLCGLNQNTLTTLAGKRLVDLLCSRKDVDAQKIGAMGASGGGTNTRFLLAHDPRIALAIPASILGSDRSHNGGDADQCLFFTINRGLSQIDLLILHAPKPLLIISASEDRHRSDRVAEYYRPFWKVLGSPQNVEFGTGEGPHGFPLGSRKIVAEFVLKHFLGDTRPVLEAEHPDDEPILHERDLDASFFGNLGYDGVGKRATDLVRERAQTLQRTRAPRAGEVLIAAVKEVLHEPAGSFQAPAGALNVQPREIGWETEGGVPLRLYAPEPAPAPFAAAALTGPRFLMYVHDRGAGTPGRPQALATLLSGKLEFAVFEPRGVGVSLAPGPESNNAMMAPMLFSKQAGLARSACTQGRSLVGMRTSDLLQAARVLKARLPGNARIDLLAEGGLGFAAVLAAVLDPGAFARVVLFRAPLSWSELAVCEARAYPFSDYLCGVLDHFDLPDLTRALPAGLVTWINPTDGGGRVLPLNVANRAHRGAPIDFRRARVPSELLRLLKK
ncbi:MAG: alpha/beta hydrolase family protein, partial [Planctomycetota bacterium]